MFLEDLELSAALGGVKENSAVRGRVALSCHTIFAVRRSRLLLMRGCGLYGGACRPFWSQRKPRRGGPTQPRLTTWVSEPSSYETPSPERAGHRSDRPPVGHHYPVQGIMTPFQGFLTPDRVTLTQAVGLGCARSPLWGSTRRPETAASRPAPCTATRRRRRAAYRKSRPQGN